MWYFLKNRKQTGPLSEIIIEKIIQEGQLNQSDLVWQEGMDGWMPAISTSLIKYFPSTLLVSQAAQTSGKARVSLMLGIIGLVSLCLFLQIVGSFTSSGNFYWVSYLLIPIISGTISLSTGYPARKEIKASNGALSGDELAVAGIVLGWICLGIIVTRFLLILILVLLGPIIGKVFSQLN